MPVPTRATVPAGVPDAVAPPPRHPRFPLIDGMRAVAVLAVLLVHCAGLGGIAGGSLGARLLAHANIGVTIFFLISGFLLYRPFVAYRGGGGAPPRVAGYAKRRCLRIFPAYWLILTILVIVPGAPGLGGVSLWPMYTLTQTIPIHPGPSCSALLTHCSLAQTWSLGAEVTFYLALPVYVVVTERLTRGLGLRAWAACQAALLAALSAASIVVQFWVGAPAPQWVQWTVTGTMFWFALGMGLAVLSVVWSAPGGAGGGRPGAPGGRGGPGGRGVPGGRAAAWIGAAAGPLWAAAIALYVGLCLWLPATSFVPTTAQQLAVHLGFGAVSLLLLAPAVFAGDGRRLPHRILAARPVAWLGLVSYGIFLWHFPVLVKLAGHHVPGRFWLLIVAGLGISAACAAASYYLVERPLMKLKYRRLIAARGAIGDRAPAGRGSASAG